MLLERRRVLRCHSTAFRVKNDSDTVGFGAANQPACQNVLHLFQALDYQVQRLFQALDYQEPK